MTYQNGFIKIGKLQISIKFVLLAAAILVLLVAIISGVAHQSKMKKERQIAGYSFEELKEIKDAECIGEKFIAYTDSSDKKGIMTLDGTITEKAEQEDIFAVSEKWGTVKYVCEGPRSEYMLLIDPEKGEIQKKQYHGTIEPDDIAIWAEELDCAVFVNKNEETTTVPTTKEGDTEVTSTTKKIEAIKPAELMLSSGLHPISNSVKKNIRYGYVNADLQLVIAIKYDEAKNFSDGLAAVKKDGKWGYIDETGKSVIDFQYDDAYGFVNGLAPVQRNGKWGIINKNNEDMTSFNLEKILQGKDGKYVAKMGGKWGILTLNEETMSEVNATSKVETTTETADDEYIVRTNGSALNMRAAADANSAKITEIPNGTAIKISKISGNWAYTIYGTHEGWVYTQYIEKAVKSTVAEPQSEVD